MSQAAWYGNLVRILRAWASLLLRGLRRLSRNPYVVTLASISSIIGFGIAVYQMTNPSPLQYVDSVKWTDASVNNILRDEMLSRAILEDKTGAGEIAFIGFTDRNEPMARFWREFSLAVSQGDIDLADHSHAALRRLIEGVKRLEISEREKETLLFYLLQRFIRMRSAHLRSADEPLLFAYLQTLSDIGYVSGEVQSPWLSDKAANEFLLISQSIVKSGTTERQVAFAMTHARWGYVQAGAFFPRSPAFAAWRAVFQTFEDLIVARHKDLWPAARALVDIRVATANDFLEMKASEDVLISELRAVCMLATRCEEVGAFFPASWGRLQFLGLLDSAKVPERSKRAIASEFLQCTLPMAVRDVDVSGAAEETSTVMAEACKALGAEDCDETIRKFKLTLDPKKSVRFRRFETKFFRPDRGKMRPARPPQPVEVSTDDPDL